MNPKNALFLSASLTAFVLAVLFGVVTKVTNTPTVAAAAPAVQATSIPDTAVPTLADPTATEQAPLGPEEAAALAAKAISREDVYSVESFSLNGTDSYKVVFSSGDIVYIGLDRMVLEKSKLKPVVVNVEPTTKPVRKHRDSNNNNNSGGVQQPPAQTSGGGGTTGGGGEDHGGGDD